ncbi:hypothetical protein P154DRAFT_532171 [Amniculicola lignicola CBS 123094]|uniref:Uncharacterized protein n=1 Tax=Amniculicola lignicola CBS 123094 TaxID=1392246 RepID=A0A6A5WR52_9PLEO|nr:hypothetical protein P154DRAFT_532171 [Amniculicola lignicola CBS 123094]
MATSPLLAMPYMVSEDDLPPPRPVALPVDTVRPSPMATGQQGTRVVVKVWIHMVFLFRTLSAIISCILMYDLCAILTHHLPRPDNLFVAFGAAIFAPLWAMFEIYAVSGIESVQGCSRAIFWRIPHLGVLILDCGLGVCFGMYSVPGYWGKHKTPFPYISNEAWQETYGWGYSKEHVAGYDRFIKRWALGCTFSLVIIHGILICLDSWTIFHAGGRLCRWAWGARTDRDEPVYVD